MTAVHFCPGQEHPVLALEVHYLARLTFPRTISPDSLIQLPLKVLQKPARHPFIQIYLEHTGGPGLDTPGLVLD